ncbi:MAG: hypothetical protein AB1Z98_00095 [Nannocystaceae bacterium]
MSKLSPTALGIVVLVCGCQLETGSVGSDTSESSNEGSDSSAGPSTATESGTTPSSDGDSTSADGSGDATTTGQPGCSDPETTLLLAADGELTGDMALHEWPDWSFDYVRAYGPDGSLTLSFDLECGGPLFLWALVYDLLGDEAMVQNPENPSSPFAGDNADSLFVAVDGQEQPWLYGCNTPADETYVWQWSEIQASPEEDCDHVDLELDLPPGGHTIVIRNRESGMGLNGMGIAAVALSHDPDTEPLMLLDPDAMGE